MAYPSSFHFPLSLYHPLIPPRFVHIKPKLCLAIFSSLSSARPCTRRKNHLRPKLPNDPPSFPLEPIESSSFTVDSSFLLVEKSEVKVEPFAVSEVSNAFPSIAAHLWFHGPVIDIAARFSALLALQTAATVWFLSREDAEKAKEERRGIEDDFGSVCKVKEKAAWIEKGMEVEEFDRMVVEIREMARQVRKREAEGIGHGGGVEEEIREGIEGRKKGIGRVVMDGKPDRLVGKNYKRRIKSMSVGVRNLPKARSFGAPKRISSESGLDKGGIQQIVHWNPGMESAKLCKPRNPNAQTSNTNKWNPGMESAKLCEPRNPNAQTSNTNKKPFEKECAMAHEFIDLNKLRSSAEKIEKYKCGSENYTSNTLFMDITEDGQSGFIYRESNTSECLAEKNKKSSMVLTKRNGKPQQSLQNKEAKCMPIGFREKESMPGSHEKQWWLKLPYVFGILLYSSSEISRYKGLYSLRINSAARDGDPQSNTISFQDRGDAINFSFLLESFFEDLGDVSADIVPLTIYELDEAIRSNELKLLVVKKGQLRLYAGQPLAEAENALKCLLEGNL